MRQEPASLRRTRFRTGPTAGPTLGRAPPTRSPSLKRIFVVGIVLALAISYIGPLHGFVTKRGELGRQEAELRSMLAERDGIRSRLRSLANPAVIEARARELGYIKPGEIPFRVTDLELEPPAPPSARSGGGFWDWLPDIF